MCWYKYLKIWSMNNNYFLSYREKSDTGYWIVQFHWVFFFMSCLFSAYAPHLVELELFKNCLVHIFDILQEKLLKIKLLFAVYRIGLSLLEMTLFRFKVAKTKTGHPVYRSCIYKSFHIPYQQKEWITYRLTVLKFLFFTAGVV